MKLPFTVAIALGIVLSGVSPAHAETDPFPGVEHMGEIPGTRISSPAWSQQGEWESTDTYQNYLAVGCPEGSGRAIAVDVAVMVWSNYCVKTWRSQEVIRAWEKYYSDEAEGRALAYEQSLAWNKANPGKQKCFPYGPLTSPDGGTTSGGVCANPVEAEASSMENPVGEDTQTDSVTRRETQGTISDATQNQTQTQTQTQTVDRSAANAQLEIAGNPSPVFSIRLIANLPRG
jgi:hypothetical protein